MCGLVAMHTIEPLGFSAFDKDEIKHMLILNSIRGSHSTGLAGIDFKHDGKVNTIKSVGSPYSLYQYLSTDVFFDRMVKDFSSVIGHGRYATHGAINADNAHPFSVDNITLAHNGVISNFYQLRDLKKHAGIDVDSQLITNLFAEESPLEVLPRVEGAYVFIWFDTKNKTFNIARNDKRPLFMAKQVQNDTMTFASELETLAWNRDRNNTQYQNIMEVATNKIITFHPDSLDIEVVPYTPIPPKVISIPKPAPVASKKEAPKLLTSNNPASISIEQKISFVIEDFEYSPHYTLLTGKSAIFPDVIFRASMTKDVSEASLICAEFVEGTVRTIFPTSKGEFTWQVFLSDAELHTDSADDDDDETRVRVENFNGSVESITKYRLKEMSKEGCAWCRASITDKDLATPERLMIYDSTPQDSGLLCGECIHQATTMQDVH